MIWTFFVGEDDKITTLIVSETSTLLIYQGTTLKWSANLSFLPVCIERVFLKDIKGAFVSLSDEGQLTCSYLGTQPSLFVAPPLNNQQIDFEQAIADLDKYNETIQENQLEGTIFASFDFLIFTDEFFAESSLLVGTKLEKDLTVTVRVSEQLQKHILESEQEVDACEIIVDMTPLATLKEVQVIVCAEETFVVAPQVFYCTSLSEKESTQFLIYCRRDSNACSLQIDVIISFMTGMGIPKVTTHTARLPFGFIADTCSPQKEATHKIVLSISQPSVPLSSLFSGGLKNI